MTDSSQTVQAEYSYDTYGNATKVSGSMDASFGYAGMQSLPTGLNGTLYDPVGNITSWTQQAGSTPAQRTDLAYDKADQLLAAVLKTDATNAVLQQNYYGYDPAGNRTQTQVDTAAQQAVFNSVNELTSTSGGGAVRFQGTVSKASTVTVNGTAASQPTSTNFWANPVLGVGTNSVSVVATDGSGNSATNLYQVVTGALGSGTSPTYDADGNMTSDGQGRTYQWDAENRLVQIGQGGNTYAFAYDGLGRRVRETDNGTLTKQWLWVGTQIAEERDATGAVTKRFFDQGEQVAGMGYFYSRDHLGSVREMTDSTQAVVAEYAYDAYGNTTKVSGSMDADFGYAGMQYFPIFGLYAPKGRFYDPQAGRWLNRDTLPDAEMSQGPNLYAYVRNNPGNFNDPTGQGLAGAAIGAVTGGVAAAIQSDGKFGDIALGAGTGLVVGFVSNGPIIGLLAGAGGDLVGQFSGMHGDPCKKFNWPEFIGATVGGAAGSALDPNAVGLIIGGALGGLGQAIGWLAGGGGGGLGVGSGGGGAHFSAHKNQ